MLTDPGDIGKANGAMEKLTDATEKLCSCVLSATVNPEDKKTIQDQVDSIGSAKMKISELLPPV